MVPPRDIEDETTGPGCPVPQKLPECIVLGHGSGGTLSNDLLEQVILPGLGLEPGAGNEDQAILPISELIPPTNPMRVEPAGSLAFTSDSFVVRPLFFPGGDIGRLAVCGTINDLAVGGATPSWLAAAFILEEGFPLTDFSRILRSMRAASAEAGVRIVTGDTKVVDRGKGDQIFINTTGIGWLPTGRTYSARNARPGDAVIISGTIGDHGITILSVREGLEFETELQSDVAPLHELIGRMRDSGAAIRCLRDPTRGGLSGTLHEWARASQVGIWLEESRIPVRREVRAACELLGLDPLHVANEGKVAVVVAREDASCLLDAMRSHPLGRSAEAIGEVTAEPIGKVITKTAIGGQRIVPMLAGEQLPRIC